jgi:hypothetical protein
VPQSDLLRRSGRAALEKLPPTELSGPADSNSKPSALYANRNEHTDVATDDASLTDGFRSVADPGAHLRRRLPAARRGRSG